MASSIISPIEPALISDSVMILDEVPAGKVETIMNAVFGDVEKFWVDGGHEEGSHVQRWYRSVATGPRAIKGDQSLSNSTTTSDNVGVRGRLIAWKTKESFLPRNLFFRTVDTFRLLPVHLADFRVQIYAHPLEWDRIDKLQSNWTRNEWKEYILTEMMHELVLLRNMHDRGGGDIPIIITTWTAEFTTRALDYWAELSHNTWSDSERNQKYTAVHNLCCRRVRPCFPQADLLVRSLLADPAVGYVPPFIVFYPATKSGRATVLFTNPLHCPPRAFLTTFPRKCSAVQCTDDDCGFFDLPESRCLSKGSKMVRQGEHEKGVVLCNLWICDVAHDPENGETLSRCQKCKEALYCSVEHQKRDWPTHKRVCEAETPAAVAAP